MGPVLAIYRKCTTQAASLAARNWHVAGSLFVYSILWTLTLVVAYQLGFVGGFLVALARAAIVASFLYLVETMIRTKRVALEDFPKSFGPYFGDVIGIFFILWIARMLLFPVLAGGGPLPVILALFVFVFFNAVPELIYLGHHSSLELFSESYKFVGENWIEWFPPNLLAFAGLVAIELLPIGGLVGWIVKTALFALALYFVMIFRGLLFQELATSSRRSRQFRWNAED